MGPQNQDRMTLAQPVAFDGCAGWLHAAPGDVGVLLVSPWGFEALCLRRAWRMLADQLARAGYPTLRFDYPGCGDSLGDAASLPGLDALQAAVVGAGARLREMTGVRRLVVVGQGLGAALALRAAQELEAEGAALLAPVARGRDYLRELSLWGMTVAETMSLTVEPGEGAAVAGFAMPERLKADLAGLDLAAATAAPGQVFVAGRPGRAAEAKLAARLRELGAVVAETAYEGYDLALGNPTAARPPMGLIQAVRDWLQDAFPGARRRAAGRLELEPPVLATPDFVETAVRFGAAGELCGVLCEPRRPRRGAAVLMLSAGADPHMGWARCNVEHARELARDGIASLRMDAADVGDSEGALSGDPVRLYDEGHIADARAGIDWLEARGLGPVLPVGRCSGAFAAFNAAARDPRIGDIVLVNQLRYIWDRDGDFELASEKVGYYRKLAKNPARLAGRWLRGEIDLDVALSKLGRAAVALVSAKLAGKARVQRRQIRETFGGLQARGVRVNLLISRDREAHEVFREFFGAEGARLKRFGDIHLRFLEGADHALTARAGRAELLDVVRATALSSPERSAAAVAAGQPAAEREDLALRPGVPAGLLPT